jgi:anaerobic magnesium-protoporphyrin IX monomethyl ester cyclase
VAEVLLGQAYHLRFDPKLWDAMRPYPPLGTLYAAAVLRQRGREVALHDAMLAGSEAEWAAAVARHRPRFAVLYEDSFNYLSKMCLLRMRQAALAMTTQAKAAGSCVIVSGSDASDRPEAYLEAGADAVIVGEGELSLAEALDALEAGRALDGVAGLALPDGRGGVRRTPPRAFIRDLDALPRPAWDLVDVERYRAAWRARHGHFSMNLVTTRGCPYHCNWCAKPIYGQRYAVRSPESVADEVAWLRRCYAPDHLDFADDIFGLAPGWLPRFARALAEREARTPFKCLSRADLLGGPAVEALRAAGCRTVWIGAESGSQRVLDAMEKGTTLEEIRGAARRLHAAGIEVGFFLQFGYPGETRADVEATLALVRECRPDDVGVSVSYPLPGTRFHDRVREQLGSKRNWTDSDDLAMLYRGPFATAFYRQLHAVVHKEFRLRRARQALVAPAGAGRRRLRQAAALAYNALTLPLARLRLEHLARAPHQGVGPLPQGLSRDEAARPTPQEA